MRYSIKNIAVGLLTLITGLTANAQYQPDKYCNGYLSRTVEQPDDYDGRVVCTVVKKPNLEGVKRAIVYVHGYNDYFFQTELGDSANAHGYNFYAVDLRKYGRSILPHQDAFFCKKISEYFADIDTTIAIARAEGNEQIVLMGHSTGGMTTPYYLKERGGKAHVDALVLNSPFLDWNMSWFLENMLVPCVSFTGIFAKRLKIQGEEEVPRSYAQSLLKKYHGEWEYDTQLKMEKGHAKRAGWVRAINRGQKHARRGKDITCPILVMSSDTTITEGDGHWDEVYHRADVVLDVNDIKRYSTRLGNKVTYVKIPGGKHDLILSQKDARDRTYQTVFKFLEMQLK
ncbi:MAG: alpha/beta hydrolase [Paludibacteraceae bacterium]|nr:alpha/beta hydrolase [Paludibacteraceae bacterium]